MRRRNNTRFDLSNRLIHFFRALNLETPDAPAVPENWGPGDLVEDVLISPFFLLRNAVRLGRLWASWSIRSNRRTIYGPHPAVCFTDMPLAAFLEAGETRSQRGEAMSPYGLVFPKNVLHSLGARPVIYGLSTHPVVPPGRDGAMRLLPEQALPLLEQYRYVTFAPSANIDWTHEREWRWPYRGEWPVEREIPPEHGQYIPGLPLDAEPMSGLGAVVKTVRQSDQLLHDVLTATDRTRLGFARFNFIIAREALGDVAVLRDPLEVEEVVADAAVTLAPFYALSQDRRNDLLARFHATVREASTPVPNAYGRETGGCWLWLTDNRHPLTRALVAADQAKVNSEGRYLVELPEFGGPGLAQREKMTRRLVKLLDEYFGLKATYHSVLNGFDPDGVPHFSDPPLDDMLHFNKAHEQSDF